MFSSKNLFVAALAFGLAVLLAGPMADADWISPTGIPYNSPEYVSGEDYGVGDLHDGIYGPLVSPKNGAVLLDDTPSDFAATGHIVFDMGSPIAIDAAKLWSRSLSVEDGNPFPRNIDFFYYIDDNPAAHTVKDDIGTDPGIVGLFSGQLTHRVSGDIEEVAFSSSVTKRYIGLRLNESWDPWTTVGERGNHIQEVMFNRVPEPSTILLLSDGLLGLLCYAWRKKK